MRFTRIVNGYMLQLEAASDAQANEAARQLAQLPELTLSAFEREDRQTRREHFDGSVPRVLPRCA